MSEITVEQAPQRARDLFNRGLAAMERNNLAYAIDMFAGALAVEPRLHQARRFLRAVEVRAWLANKPSALGQIVIRLRNLPVLIAAQALLKSGKPMQAIAKIEKALRLNPLDMQLIKVLGQAAEEADEPDIAIQTLALAREHDAKNPLILNWLGNLYMQTGQTRLGRECYEALCEIKPNDPASLKALKDAMAMDSMSRDGWERAAAGGSFRAAIRDEKTAIILEKEAKAVKSEQDLEALIADTRAKIEREPANMNYRRALAHLYAGAHRYAEALRTIEEALQAAGGRDPQLANAASAIRLQEYDHRIEIETDRGHTAAAQALTEEKNAFLFNDVQSRVAQYPNELGLKYQFGVLLYERGRLVEAIQQFQIAQRSPQHRLDALYRLGVCFKDRKQYDLAAEQLEKAIADLPSMDPRRKDALYELGQVFEAMGAPDKALACYKQIYQLDIGYRDVADKVERGYVAQSPGEK